MGIRIMSKEKEDNLIEINVLEEENFEGFYECEGRFDTSHVFVTCDFTPDDGWYRIATYTKSDLRKFKEKGIPVTYHCKEWEELDEDGN